MSDAKPTVSFPERLLLGPGPSNAHPRVLAAMAQPLVGHLDPAFLELLDEVNERLARLFGVPHGEGLTVPISATGSAGMEACLVNLLEPGDAIVVGVAGVFGERMCEVARRAGAVVHRVEAEPGTALDPAAFERAIAAHSPKVVAFVHAETSTGLLQPVEAIASAARSAGALVVLDCVTSLGGVALALEAWGVDAAYSGTQKCLSCPPGLSPITFSRRALERVRERSTPVQSWYLDVHPALLVLRERAPSTTTLRRSLRSPPWPRACGSSKRKAWKPARRATAPRRRRYSSTMEPMGFRPLVAPEVRLPQLSSLLLPDAVVERGEASVRRSLLERHGIEVGGGLGKLAGKIWRVGLMGQNANPSSVERLCEALRQEL